MLKKKLDKIPATRLPLIFMTALRSESDVLFSVDGFDEQLRSGRFRLFRRGYSPVYLAETGMGRENTGAVLEQILKELKFGLLINYGICGALDSEMALGQSYLIGSVVADNRPRLEIQWNEVLSLNKSQSVFPVADLYTVNAPVDNKATRNHLKAAGACPLVDMEAYWLAELALDLQIPMISLKTVSDFAVGNVREDVRRRLPELQKEMKNSLCRLLNIISAAK